VAGYFVIGDGDTINVGINPETVDVHVTHGNVSGGPRHEETHLFSVSAIREGGLSFYPHPSCASTRQQFVDSGVTGVCSLSTTDTAFRSGAGIDFLKYFGVMGGYMNGGTVKLHATATIPTIPGSSLTDNGFFSTRGWFFEGLVRPLPVKHLDIAIHGGLQTWGASSGTTFTAIIPGLPNTVNTTFQKNSGVAPVIGVDVEYWIVTGLGFNATYLYTVYHDGSSVDEINHQMLFGIKLRVFPLPRFRR
jgi:hypothetical protein